MSALCFYFQVPQPYRLRHYTFFDIGVDSFYEDEDANCGIMLKVARKCYLPMNALLLKLIRKYDGRFKVSFSISGTALDQFEAYAPEVIQSFRELVATGCVELLSETYNHSLAFLYSPEEFREQVALHDERIEALFGVTPRVFRNTELIYNNDLARAVEAMGYKAVLAEGADHVLGWRSPNFVYRPAGCDRLKLLLKNYRLSDDIAFRFSNHQWPEFPLTADKFSEWAHAANASGDLINLFMDYETFGEHQWESTGIFAFMEALPEVMLRTPGFAFITPSEAAARFEPVAGEPRRAAFHVVGGRRARSHRMARQRHAERRHRIRLSLGEGGQGHGRSRRAPHMAASADLRPFLLHVHEVVLGWRRAQLFQPLRHAVRRLHQLYECARRFQAYA